MAQRASLASLRRVRSRVAGAVGAFVLTVLVAMPLLGLPMKASAQGAPGQDSPASEPLGAGKAISTDLQAPSSARAQAPSQAPSQATSDASSSDGPAPLTDRQFEERARGFDARQRVLDDRTTQMNYHYAVEQHDCYSRFFVNACLDKARDAMRIEKGEIRTARLALSDERRSDRARKRDQDAAAAQQREQAEAPARAANDQRNRAAYAAKQQQHAADQAKRGDDAALRASNVAAYDKKQADHQALIDEAQRNAAADAQKRAQNVSRFEQKQKDAADRQAQLLERQRQAKERADKQAQQQQQGQPSGNRP